MTTSGDFKVTEIPLTTLLQLIPDFDTNVNSQVYRFIRSCDSAFQLSSIVQKEILLIYALNKITGPASSDVHAKQFTDWNELKTFLIQKFSHTKTLAHLNLELQTMFQKPSESITQYYHRVDLCRNKIMEKLTAEIFDVSLTGRKLTAEETALNVFINGISSDIGIMLRTKNLTNLSDAGHFAMQEEKIRLMNSARQSLYRPSRPFIRPVVPNSRPPNSQIPTTSTFVRPPAVPFNNKQCNYCKKFGHLIAECRKRAYNNQNKLQTSQGQLALPAPVNHLNSQTAMEMGSSMETVSVHYSSAQTPTSTQGMLTPENLEF